MQRLSLPGDELKRLSRFRAGGSLGAAPQAVFDEVTALTSTVCAAPIAVIALMDGAHLWFKSTHGLAVAERDHLMAFCAQVIQAPSKPLVVEDTALHFRWAAEPRAPVPSRLRLCAGTSIVNRNGQVLGTVCVADHDPRPFSDAQLRSLVAAAKMVVSLLEDTTTPHDPAHPQPRERVHQSKVLAALTASGLDLISYIGPDFVYRYVNHRYLTYWGMKESDIVGRQVVDLVGESFFESTVRPHLVKAMAGQAVEFEAHVDFTGVGKRHVEVAYVPARDEDGSLGVVVRSHDIDAIKVRKAQLREALALLEHKSLEQERFIHIISHDLREPINTINNFASLLAEDSALALSDQGRRYLRFVQAGGQRVAALLNDLLHFVRLDKHALELKPVDLNQIADEVQADLTSLLMRSGGHIQQDMLPQVVGDASLLRIVLQNLISNGLKFTHRGTPPRVRLTAYCENNMAHVCVADNGVGIPADKLGSIFEMFKRLHSAKEFDGTGLGLSICRRIAELHGGHVSVASTEGEGSCFTLSLPLPGAGRTEGPGDEHL